MREVGEVLVFAAVSRPCAADVAPFFPYVIFFTLQGVWLDLAYGCKTGRKSRRKDVVALARRPLSVVLLILCRTTVIRSGASCGL
jgi:hypothetical protein